MLVVSVAVIRPMYIRVGEALSSLEKQLVEKAETLTGFTFSYQSLSPSILSAINIKGIVVSDKTSGKKMLDINRVTVSYNFLDFFSAHPAYAIRSVTINGVTVEYDMLTDKETFLGFVNMFRKSDEEKAERTARRFDLTAFNIDLPFVVQVKNLSFHYSDQHNDVLATLKNLSLRNSMNANGITARGNGRARYFTPHVHDKGKPIIMAANFDINGTLMPELDGSTATVRLTSASNADFTVSHMDVLVDYSDLVMQMRTMRSTLPYSAAAQLHFGQKTFDIAGQFAHFNPYQLVRMRRMPRYLQIFENSRMTGTASFAYANHAFSYDGDLMVDVTKTLFGEDEQVAFQVAGNRTEVRLKKFVVSGPVLQGSFEGAFDIPKRQPSGTLTCDYWVLPNGNALSTELYIDPFDTGFMCVSPQLFLGERYWTGLQLYVYPREKSCDFTFEASDYSHPEFIADTGGGDDAMSVVLASGSLELGQSPFVQAQIELKNIFLDSAILTGAFFVTGERGERLKKTAKSLEHFVMTDELYISSDFKNFTFNAPLCIVGNTMNSRHTLTFAVDVSNQTMEISKFDLLFNNVSTTAAVTVDFTEGFKDFSFFGDFTVNSVPYRFNGAFVDSWLTVAGDYDFDAAVGFDDETIGSLRFTALPVSYGSFAASLSANTTFTWKGDGEFTVELLDFSAEDVSGFFRMNPRLSLVGTINQYGFMMQNMTYADSISVLNGVGSMLWNINDGIFDSIHLDMNAASPLTQETLSLLADVTNPNHTAFSVDALKNEFYFDAQADVEAFPIARFVSEQNADNAVSAAVTASGTISNPFVSLDVRSLSAGVYGSSLVAHGAAVLDDSGISIEGLTAQWAQLRITDARAKFNPSDFSGSAAIPFSGIVMNEVVSVPLAISLTGVPPVEKWHVPQNYSLTVKSDAVTGGLFPKPLAFAMTLMHMPGRFDVVSQSNDGLVATFLDGGVVTAHVGTASPVQFDINGLIEKKTMNLEISKIMGDFAELSSVVALPFLSVSSGILRGAVRINGLIADPEFTGALSIDNPAFMIPMISKTNFYTDRILATIGQNGLSVPQTKFLTEKGAVLADARIEFNRWKMGMLDLNLQTPEKNYVPVNMSLPFIRYKGNVGLDSMSITMEGSDLAFTGAIFATDADVEVVISSLQDSLMGADLLSLIPFWQEDEPQKQKEKGKGNLVITADLDILIGQRVQMRFDPFLRGVIVPNTPLAITFDGNNGTFSLKGDVALRGGQIVWLNRNFYMKEGKITFNESQDLIDPRITVRAETRERDTNGSPVTITLSAQNQPLSSFTPQFTASPAKSESEIMVLLGQVITADSESAGQFGGAAGDMLLQSLVINRIENALRETMHFDIFSVRTNFLQNAVKLNSDRNSVDRQTGFSNYFDNSAVYIGKYFGSSIYADALMHWTYDETKSDEAGSVGNLVFQPEFGLEMASPFVNIRWGIAPNLEALQNNLWVPSTSITLSWKLSF